MPLLAAPFAGSLAGVLIRRIPAGRPVGWARSTCESCGRTLSPRELVPLLSYVVQSGACRGCGAPIGRFHPAVELLALAVAAWVVAVSPTPWADCALGWTLLTLGWIDRDNGRLPDALTLPLLIAGLGQAWVAEPWWLLDRAVGACTGYVAFRLVSLGYRAWRGREGLGAGDAKLLAAAGAWVGWQGLGSVVALGAVATLGLAVWRGRLAATAAVPFGPGLALATLAVRLHGPVIAG